MKYFVTIADYTQNKYYIWTYEVKLSEGNIAPSSDIEKAEEKARAFLNDIRTVSSKKTEKITSEEYKKLLHQIYSELISLPKDHTSTPTLSAIWIGGYKNNEILETNENPKALLNQYYEGELAESIVHYATTRDETYEVFDLNLHYKYYQDQLMMNLENEF